MIFEPSASNAFVKSFYFDMLEPWAFWITKKFENNRIYFDQVTSHVWKITILQIIIAHRNNLFYLMRKKTNKQKYFSLNLKDLSKLLNLYSS